MSTHQNSEANTDAKPHKKPKKFDPKVKLGNAVKAAKQRCTNVNNPDYPNYGGKGIKCLLTTKEVECAIGLPKNSDLSLDRIDPAGNYEIGNIRWTNKHVQAANKKKTTGTSSFDQLQQQAKEKASTLVYRQELTALWKVGIRLHNFGGGTKKEAEFIHSTSNGICCLKAAFKFSDIRDFALPPRVFCLPSCTCPGQRIKIGGGPWKSSPYGCDLSSEAANAGVIWGLGCLPLKLNVPQREIDLLCKSLQSETLNGIIWSGQTSVGSNTHYPIEGRMLAIASRLAIKFNKSAHMMLATDLFSLIENAAPFWLSELESHPVLTAKALFLPDIQVENGLGWSPSVSECGNLLRLLQYRRKYGFKTYLGIQKLDKLTATLKEFLAQPGSFERCMAGTYSTPEWPEPETFEPYPAPTEEYPI